MVSKLRLSIFSRFSMIFYRIEHVLENHVTIQGIFFQIEYIVCANSMIWPLWSIWSILFFYSFSIFYVLLYFFMTKITTLNFMCLFFSVNSTTGITMTASEKQFKKSNPRARGMVETLLPQLCKTPMTWKFVLSFLWRYSTQPGIL